MKLKVFIDGSAGTTGLRIRERLEGREDIELIKLSEELRKDTMMRKIALNSADIAFLCLPDAAAIEAGELVENPYTAIIDTSTAHRTNDAWEYGFPELEGRKEKIALSKRIANPGCHASGAIALLEPLIKKGLLNPEAKLSITSLTGYSGGGKKMIADYSENLSNSSNLHLGGRTYALSQTHKHLPEILKIAGLKSTPAFLPIVVPHYSGMEVSIPVFAADLKGGIDDLKRCYQEYYTSGLVKFVEDPSEGGFLSSAKLSGKDTMEVSVYGNAERVLLVARFDNLGKGASGAAIENMNVLMGLDPKTGLEV